MRTIPISIFQFNELSSSAKELAKYNHGATGFAWEEDYLESLKALAKHFDSSLEEYGIDFGGGTYSEWKFSVSENLTHEEIADRLSSLGSVNPETLKGNGECKLTGFCGDEDAIDGFRKAFLEDGETDLKELLNAAAKSWLEAAQADYRAQYEDENFQELCEANEYEFYADGSLYCA